MPNKISLQQFFNSDMRVTSFKEFKDKIVIKIKSKTKKQFCPLCRSESSYHQATYERVIDDLPLFGKSVQLIVTAYKYKCFNPKCEQKVFCEELHGFAGKYRRRSQRCEDLIAAIGLNTNCESGALICRHMGIDISGDTVIRIMLRRAEERSEEKCSDIIGVDDWAYKKGHTYGTVICDGVTHNPITILDGRDGTELKKWLENNKHIKTVTRDRAGAYASAISQVIPDAIQVSDRFHLFNNLMHAVKHAINSQLPEKINISEEQDCEENDIFEDKVKTESKKNQTNNEKELTDYQKRLREFIVEVQSLYKEGYSKSQIVKMLKTTYKRIRKYLYGDPDLLCRSDGRNTYNRESILEPYKTRIKQLLSEGNNYKEIFRKIKSGGYPGKYTILCDYCSSLVSCSPKAKSRKMKPKQYVNRSDIFKYLWSDNKEKVNDDIFEKVALKYPKVKEIQDCINDFREIFDRKSISLLNEFINKYKKSNIRSISGFTGGLTKDKKAVENSVTSQYSNGFVEGNNNRLKLIKRQMYGRAKLPLLKAKIIMKNDIFLPCVNQN